MFKVKINKNKFKINKVFQVELHLLLLNMKLQRIKKHKNSYLLLKEHQKKELNNSNQVEEEGQKVLKTNKGK